MSNSRKKTPKRGVTSSTTEKDNKRQANRKLRRIHRQQVQKGDTNFVLLREISNVWAFDKDGKIYLKNPTRKEIRK